MNDEVRITLRLPANLRDALLSSAESSNRSMNAEIISRLSQTFSQGDDDIVMLLHKALAIVSPDEILISHRR